MTHFSKKKWRRPLFGAFTVSDSWYEVVKTSVNTFMNVTKFLGQPNSLEMKMFGDRSTTDITEHTREAKVRESVIYTDRSLIFFFYSIENIAKK